MEKEIFPDEETFRKVYEECMERSTAGSDAVKDGYKKLSGAFEDYLYAEQERTFRYAYQCGYEAALQREEAGGGRLGRDHVQGDPEMERTISDMIFHLSIDHERAVLMADEISHDYFGIKDDSNRIHYFASTAIKFNILDDYIYRMEEKIDEINKIIRAHRKQCDMEGGAA
ncbi:MAG: hypothetical protein K1W10_07990 [Lachnospiraceae bacterium]